MAQTQTETNCLVQTLQPVRDSAMGGEERAVEEKQVSDIGA